MNRNVSILIIVLAILLITVYLLLLRSRIQIVNSNTEVAPPAEKRINEESIPTLGIVAASPSAVASSSGKVPTAKPTK